MTVRCATHVSGFHGHPCAWPECIFGIAANQFPDRSENGTAVWERVRIDSYSGDERYFWRSSGSAWSSLEKDLRTREFALAQREDHTNEHVYHYTTVAAFKQIIETQELWLSDYAYLNDSSEITHGLALAGDVFETSPAADKGCGDLFRSFLSLAPEDQPRICVACFSFERDSLTQWKGYGAGTLGISFGIDATAFARSTGNMHTARYTSVVYRDTVKRHLLRTFAHDWGLLLGRDRAAGDGHLDSYEKIARIYFFELLAMLKHESFRDEREFRIIYQEHSRLFAGASLDLAPKRFRIAGPLIVPFTSTRDMSSLRLARGQGSDGSRIAIIDVVVGPHALKDLAASGIREFLHEHGYDVDVEPSRVPFR
jgi:hypothetical protein